MVNWHCCCTGLQVKKNIKKQLTSYGASWPHTHEHTKVASGIKKYTPIKCGWMACTWANLFMQNMRCCFTRILPFMILPTNSYGWKNTHVIQKQDCCTMHGMKAKNRNGPIKQREPRHFFGPGRWAGT